MLVLVLSANSKFIECLQAPFTIVEQVSPVNYCLHLLGKIKSIQMYYIILLKHFI